MFVETCRCVVVCVDLFTCCLLICFTYVCGKLLRCVHQFLFGFVDVFVCVRKDDDVCLYVCLHVCLHVCLNVCVHVCLHVCLHRSVGMF